ncbi:hypothetical protein H6F93_15265 [Leptolyngbya sp. FACHB-671]|nr:hypothetical protein [Leptolyngbya sp. FACHB-671]
MSLRLLFEDSQAKYLINLLGAAGHNVLVVNAIQAIANLEPAEHTLQNQFIVLNQWNY